MNRSGRSPFKQLLGEAFAQLPAATQLLHGDAPPMQWHGEAQVRRGASLLSRLMGRLARLPPAADQVSVQVHIESPADGTQLWRRKFGSARMPSKLSADQSLLREDLGAVTLWFALSLRESGIDWQVRRVRLLRWLPLPVRWFKRVHAWSGASASGYCFMVHAELPLAGLLVRYAGWLEPVTATCPAEV